MSTLVAKFLASTAVVALSFSSLACSANNADQLQVDDERVIRVASIFIENRTNVLIQPEQVQNILNEQDFSGELRQLEVGMLNNLQASQVNSASLGTTYTHAVTELKILGTRVNGAQTVFTLNDYTELYYDLQFSDGGPEFTAWSVDREFAFETVDGTFKLVSQKLVNDQGLPSGIDPAA